MRTKTLTLAGAALMAGCVLAACSGSASPEAATESGAASESAPPAEEAAPVPPDQQPTTAPAAPVEPPQGSYPGEALVGPVETTASGLQYSVLAEGDGAMPSTNQMVQVHYTGYLPNGTEFDSSVGGPPISFPLGQQMVVQGWDEGIALMKVGEKRKLILPPALGYGSTGKGPVPPDSWMIFDVELVGAQ